MTDKNSLWPSPEEWERARRADADLKQIVRDMRAAICCICKCSVDTHAPHAIVNHDYAHLDCADLHDGRDLGCIDLPERVRSWHEEYSDAVGVSLTREL